jgi:O-antigen biosynthesis protein
MCLFYSHPQVDIVKQCNFFILDSLYMPNLSPFFSIVTPVFNTDEKVLKDCIDSVKQQSFTNWELILVDDCSTKLETQDLLRSELGRDPRVKIYFSEKNLHIAEASNLGVRYSRGKFIGLLDHDDTLTPYSLERVYSEIEKSRLPVDVVYSDEDKIDFDGTYCDPYFKPSWSPEHLLSVMYLLHFLVFRRSLFLSIDGFRDIFSGAQDYDLALRLTAKARKIVHIPEILYHWRKVEGSASAEIDAKPYALINGKKALEDHISNGKIGGVVTDGLLKGFFRVRYSIPANTKVTLLILSAGASRVVDGRGEIVLLDNFLKSIAQKTSYGDYEVLVVHNNELSEGSLNLIESLKGKAIAANDNLPFNYARRINYAFSQVKTEYVIALNDDLEVINADWIESLIEWLSDEQIGIVGPRLLYPDNTVQHSGVSLLNNFKGATHHFYKMPKDEIGYNGYTHLVRNYAAVTGAVMATKKSLFNLVGGFDTRLSTDYNDVDFCLKLYEQGYRTVFTPHCELYHFESSTIKRSSQSSLELDIFNSKWSGLVSSDPYINISKIKSLMPWSIDPNNTAPI